MREETLRVTTSYATRRAASGLAALALAGVMGVTGCNDFLQGGELSTDPVRPTAATNQQLFVGAQTNTWSQLSSDPARIVGLWTQQFEGIQSQYFTAYTYGVSEQTTNGFHSSLYAGGGLKDIRQLQANARAQGDTLFLGIAQVQEAILIGTGADMFGDLVYSEALDPTKPNPKLDEQLTVYDAVQALLSSAITNLSSFTGAATNLGPQGSDLNYGGDPDKRIALAHTLKARFYLHTAEVRPGAYALALAQARLGIADSTDDYKAVFSGNANESNFWFQFTIEQRFGYAIGNPFFIDFLQTRNDPRLAQYLDESGDYCGDPYFCLAGNPEDTPEGERIDPNFNQPLVTAQENYLIWAEAAYRTGAIAEAVTALTKARAIAGLAPASATSGPSLLQAILDEKYIALFQNIEVWNDYKRTCYPNLDPVVTGLKIPARFLYDTGERQTNTSIPQAQDQPTRNDNDPPNATDPFGNVCKGQ